MLGRCAHNQEVNYIEDNGLLKFAGVGNVDTGILPATEVLIYGKEIIQGVITSIPPHLSKEDKKKVKKIEDLSIDCGFENRDEALKKVKLGDVVTFATKFKILNGNICSGKSFDDRAGIVAIFYALEKLKNAEKSNNQPFIIFSDLEEIGEIGAKIASKKIKNVSAAVVVDVSFAKSTDEPKEKCGELGKGPMIGLSPTLNRSIFDKISDLSTNSNIPFQLEIMAGLTSTNADQYAMAGFPSSTISIPLRYMHTPTEVLNVDDIISTGELLAEFIIKSDL
ncbi:MAG: M42 family peptidase [Oscillospiraceae bacterium]|nr:M42 family peptidase [Oscillospiraceae bacterium]